eukprot:9079335-Heterocapsa_arctica.AAC.1
MNEDTPGAAACSEPEMRRPAAVPQLPEPEGPVAPELDAMRPILGPSSGSSQGAPQGTRGRC